MPPESKEKGEQGEHDVMRKYKTCHEHLDKGEATVKIVANLAVASLWFALTPFHKRSIDTLSGV